MQNRTGLKTELFLKNFPLRASASSAVDFHLLKVQKLTEKELLSSLFLIPDSALRTFHILQSSFRLPFR
jgi:hypothetical protein